MARNEDKCAGLSVGAAEYRDKALVQCPAAASSAKEIAEALDAKLFRVRVVANPATGDMLFGDVQQALRDAKGGSFFLYFAGHALRRGGDVLLAVGESEVEGTRGCVPLSDVLDIVRRSKVTRGLVILNIDLPPDARAAGLQLGEGITVIGSSRTYDAKASNVRFGEYGGAVLQALRLPALEMSAYLSDGRLDGAGLGRYLAAKAPAAVKVEVYREGAEQLMLRDLAAQLAAETAAAEKAAAEKAAADKAAAEKAAADKAAAEKAAAERKAAAEKAAAEKAAADKAAAEKEAAEKAAAEKEAAEKAHAEEEEPAKEPPEEDEEEEEAEVERPISREPSAALAASPKKGEPSSSNLPYIIALTLLVLGVVAYLLANR